MNLADRITAEIERDVQLANGEDEQAHGQRHWPDRIERQAQAFRRIRDRHGPIQLDALAPEDRRTVCSTCHVFDDERYDFTAIAWPCAEIRDLAAIYDIEVPQ